VVCGPIFFGGGGNCQLRLWSFTPFHVKLFLSMLKAFVDDSGSGGDSPWVVLAGYVGTVCDWVGFESDWSKVLESQPRIEYFKSSEAESLKGQFVGASIDQRNAKIEALIDVIGRHAQRAICARMRQDDYNEVIRPNVPEIWDDAYFFLFPAFILAVLGMEKYHGNSEPAEFICDSSQRVDKRAAKLYHQLKQFPQFAGRIIDVFFRSDKEFLPLQAADLLAWQVRRFFCVPDEPRRAHFERAKDCPQQNSFSIVLGRNDLKELLVPMENNVRNYAAAQGIPLDVLKEDLFKRRRKTK
jgi:hypothetical protein